MIKNFTKEEVAERFLAKYPNGEIHIFEREATVYFEKGKKKYSYSHPSPWELAYALKLATYKEIMVRKGFNAFDCGHFDRTEKCMICNPDPSPFDFLLQ